MIKIKDYIPIIKDKFKDQESFNVNELQKLLEEFDEKLKISNLMN